MSQTPMSIIKSITSTTPEKRNVKKVPFVELFENRIQGVISSGSDINRVYVAFIESSTLDFYCSTNNNRPCGGLYGAPCKHIRQMVDEAVHLYGWEKMAHYLEAAKIASPDDLWSHTGQQKKEPASMVFSRFLSYLRYLELESSHDPIPEMVWFT